MDYIFESYKAKGQLFSDVNGIPNNISATGLHLTKTLENLGFDLSIGAKYTYQYGLYSGSDQIGKKWHVHHPHDYWNKFELWYKMSGEILVRLNTSSANHAQFHAESGLKANPKQKIKKQFPTLYDIFDNPIEVDMGVVYSKGNSLYIGKVLGWGNKKLNVTQGNSTTLVYPHDVYICDQNEYLMHLLKK